MTWEASATVLMLISAVALLLCSLPGILLVLENHAPRLYERIDELLLGPDINQRDCAPHDEAPDLQASQ